MRKGSKDSLPNTFQRKAKRMRAPVVLLVLLIVLVGGYVFTGLFAPFFAPYPKGSIEPLYAGEAGDSPSWRHPFGVDASGHDLFSESIFAARDNLAVAGPVFIVLIIAWFLVNIYFKRRVEGPLDRFLMKLFYGLECQILTWVRFVPSSTSSRRQASQ
jgi:ABC-type dipeptide/oligopeptide/nickel transport system permease subunit